MSAHILSRPFSEASVKLGFSCTSTDPTALRRWSIEFSARWYSGCAEGPHITPRFGDRGLIDPIVVAGAATNASSKAILTSALAAPVVCGKSNSPRSIQACSADEMDDIKFVHCFLSFLSDLITVLSPNRVMS